MYKQLNHIEKRKLQPILILKNDFYITCPYLSKTELAIPNAFIDLLKVKAFEDIHINEICKKAKVTKVTFYNHFSNKLNLLNKIM
ncbi:MAG: TetR/AcrR family transcriptional regulator [Candidatus Onthovivens sp.]